jgi:hypothetical protein
MPIHINELHTDIRPATGDDEAGDSQGARGSGESVEDVWREARGHRLRIEARTAADGYED